MITTPLRTMPGQFRTAGHDVIVCPYKLSLGKDVVSLVVQLCDWLKKVFHYEDGKQNFIEQVLHAIVSHVYIAWIHPFDDGNGRTVRLIEFFLLLRAGLPNIASHILSNHYNNTREEYYRQLEQAGKEKNLSRFIAYAVLGFRDGLDEVGQRNGLTAQIISGLKEKEKVVAYPEDSISDGTKIRARK